jgi:transcriptional regulator with XRE-family HTH domain
MSNLLNVEKLRRLREAADLSQAAAASAAGVTRQRWNDIESGRKTNIELDTLEAIAKAVKAKPKDLLK